MKRQFYIRRGVALVTFLMGVALVYVWFVYLSPVVEYLRSPAVDVEALMSATPRNSPHVNSFQSYTEEEYAVYSAVIEDFQKRAVMGQSRAQGVVIISQTAPDSLTDGMGVYAIERSMGEQRLPERELLENYEIRNRRRSMLDASFKSSLDYKLITTEEVERLFDKQGGWWQEFFQKYPNTHGLFSFSGVGFNAEFNRALVFLAFTCGGTCGNGTYYVLTKHNGVWRVHETIGVWIS